MEILDSFDSGVSAPWEATETGIRFDLRGETSLLHVNLTQCPNPVNVSLIVEGKSEKFLARQGLVIVPEDGEPFATPLEKIQDSPSTFHAAVPSKNGSVRIASRYPYGRDSLDQLLCDTSGRSVATRWRFLRRRTRGFPLFEAGDPESAVRVHFFFAGEDAWETAGSWVADAMIRHLVSNSGLLEDLTRDSAVRIAPLVSLYTATTGTRSYRTPEGKSIYGAATWGDEAPPIEYSLCRDLVVNAIQEKKLGFMMTIHSWQAQSDKTQIQTIQRARNNRLSASRQEWANSAMRQITKGVPRAEISLPEEIWHPGLARDYLLAEHGTATFRVETTTWEQGLSDFRETGRRFIENLRDLTDWSGLYDPG